jgi:hypothetical protein
MDGAAILKQLAMVAVAILKQLAMVAVAILKQLAMVAKVHSPSLNSLSTSTPQHDCRCDVVTRCCKQSWHS